MAIGRTGSTNNRVAFTGMASGLDTDSIIQATLSTQKFKIDSTQKKLQLAEWRRDQYREISSALTSFKSQFMDVLNKTNFMLSSSAYKKYKTTAVNEKGETSTLVSVTGNSNANTGNSTIKVVQNATAATTNTGNISKPIETGKVVSDLEDITEKNNTFTITVDGATKKIELDIDGYNKALALDKKSGKSWNTRDFLQTAVDNAVGSGKVIVGPRTASPDKPSDGALTFSAGSGVTKIELTGATALALPNYTTNTININGTLEDAVGNSWTKDGDNYKIKINGQEFIFDKKTKVTDVMRTINSNTDAAVSMSYDELSNSFAFKAKNTGAGSTLDIKGINKNDGNPLNIDSGRDAQAYINGTLVTRSDNKFTVNGLTYEILREPTDAEKATINDDPTLRKGVEQSIDVKLDTDSIFEGIKTFVDKYNEMILKFNIKLNEKYDKDYQPLTDEEKESLSENQIDKLEKKAQTGLLRNDSIVSKLVSDMRNAFYTPTDGVSGGVYNIGITTGTWDSNGVIEIDEEKLRKAIEADPDRIADIFNKNSKIDYSTTMSNEDRKTRYNESGIMQRLKDIIEDNITTSVNNSGVPGKLIAKAGMEGTRFDKTNMIFDEMLDYQKQIKKLWDVYDRKEQSLRKKYANLETLMSKLNSQTNSLAGMLGQ